MSPNQHGKANHPQHAENPTRGNVSRPTQADQRPDFSRFRDDVPHLEGPQPGGASGPAVCTRCHAIRHHKHWHLDEATAKALLAQGDTEQVICPGCVKVERQEYDGQVVLTGAFLNAHQEEIIGLIRNTESHIREHNPIARIASVTATEDRVEVLTISPFLAERIGKEVRKAYDGELEIKHPERQEFIRVTWMREA
jgi:hypothetical protein